MLDRTGVSVIPINGDSAPGRSGNRTKIGCRGSPANAVAYFEQPGFVTGHFSVRLTPVGDPKRRPRCSVVGEVSIGTASAVAMKFNKSDGDGGRTRDRTLDLSRVKGTLSR